MKKSTLIILSALTIVIAIAAIMTTSQRGSHEVSSTEKGLFYPELKDKIDSINKVILTSPSKKLEFAKQEELWVATHKDNYPANAGLIQKTLNTLASMNKTDAKTKKPEGYPKLGVEEQLNSGSRGFILQGFANDTPVIHTHIGARASTGKDEFYVRDHSQEQVFQVRGDLSLKDDDETWLSSTIIDFDKNRIMAVDFIDDEGNKFMISRESAKETSFNLTPMPAGRKIKSPYIIDVASKGLTKMVLSDVKPLSEFAMSETPFASYRLFDGIVVHVFYAENPKSGPPKIGLAKKGWIRLISGIDQDQRAKGLGKKSTEELQAEVDRLNARHAEWAYHIPSYKLEQIKRSLESLLDPIDEKKKKGKKVS